MNNPFELKYPLPVPGDPGYFGALRKFDIHTGIDLYCEDGTPVAAMEDGVVVGVEKFTGEHAGSSWWNNTWAILVEGKSGVIVYGEIIIDDSVVIGSPVTRGQLIGHVKQVLKVDKGVTPTSMLHLELLEHGCYHTLWWYHGEPQPEELRNPIILFG